MPTLDVVATTNKKAPDRITLTSDITDICDDHKHGHIAVRSDKVKVTQKKKKGSLLDVALSRMPYHLLIMVDECAKSAMPLF